MISRKAQGTSWRDAFLYEFYEYPAEHCARRHRGIRTERWKLIHFWQQPEEWELYDLETDPDEMRNLIGQRTHEPRVRELRSRLDVLRRETADFDPPGPAGLRGALYQQTLREL